MFRAGKTLLKKIVITVSIESTPCQNAICIQQARGLRPKKPAYSGIAKSKLFRIPKQPNYPEDEAAEIRRLNNQHRLYMRSISHFFKVENESHSAGSKEALKGAEEDEAEWQESLRRINQWNNEVAEQRNARLSLERKLKEEEIKERILTEQRNQQLRLEEIDQIVRREKELSASYITPENIDQAIALALEGKVDYNYAIDMRGQKYIGRFVNAGGVEEMPNIVDENEESLPPLFQSSPVSSGFTKN